MKLSKTAMILAAGFGKRLGEITKNTPKPLVSINKTNCLEIAINILKKIGYRRIIVNTHYLADQIERFLKNFSNMEIIISYEEEILETAGGIHKVIHEFDGNNFLAVNADIYWQDTNPSFVNCLQKNMQDDDLFTLGVIPIQNALSYTGSGDFIFKENNLLQKPNSDPNKGKFVYMGVQIINPKAFNNLEIAPMSLSPLYTKASAENKLRGSIFNGKWVDIGTIEGLEIANKLESNKQLIL